MPDNQIFISYSRKNKDLASKLYNDLLCDEYPVWMDEALEEIRAWKPQIESNLRERFNSHVVSILSMRRELAI